MVKNYRNALQKLWKGLCDVYTVKTIRNPANGRDEPTEVQVLQKQPCRLSFSSISSTTEQDSAPLTQQSLKLFLDKSVAIPPGSKIVVTQEGRDKCLCAVWSSCSLQCSPSGDHARAFREVCVMARWGRCDFSQYRELANSFGKLSDAELDHLVSPAVKNLRPDFWRWLSLQRRSANTRKAPARKAVLSGVAGAQRTAKPLRVMRSP